MVCYCECICRCVTMSMFKLLNGTNVDMLYPILLLHSVDRGLKNALDKFLFRKINA